MLPRSGSAISAGDATKEQDRQCIDLACSSIRRQPKRWLHADEHLYLYGWKPRFRVGFSASEALAGVTGTHGHGIAPSVRVCQPAGDSLDTFIRSSVSLITSVDTFLISDTTMKRLLTY
ncbi:hypothetical protein PUN28_006861 [Cardiocondyla obscurior]|uniref:Uncharacterized protein n=1 Tax=Cardiocondyla obscurior TaxID=286306 RepID=A0AAW2G3K8_9HYME